jgi:hypothetical protein
MNRLVPHHGERGRANELTLFQLLESLLPSNISIGSGIIFDSFGNASGQTDLILYDASSQPRFLAQTTQFLYPVETVLAAIEVKTTLDEEELGKASSSRQRLRSLRSSNGSLPPPFYLMAYAAGHLPETMTKKLGEIQVSDRPDYLCILDVAVLGGTRTSVTSENTNYFAGLAALHTLADSGDRISQHWQQPSGTGRTYTRGEVSYRITALSQSNRTRIVCEPGRALLLYCERILTDLHNRGAAAQPFVSAYLTGRAHERPDLFSKELF